MVLVFPGLPETLARLFLPVMRFRSDDFPTLDLPAKATSVTPSGGYWERFTATVSSSELFIFIILFNDYRYYFLEVLYRYELDMLPYRCRDILEIRHVLLRNDYPSDPLPVGC